MASVVIKLNGVDLNNAELSNAATESTLNALLSDSQTFWKLFKDDSKKQADQRKIINKKFDQLLSLVGALGAKTASAGSTNSASGSPTANVNNVANVMGEVGEAAEGSAAGMGELLSAVMDLVPEIGLAVIALSAFEIAAKTINAVVASARHMFDAFVDGKNKLSDYTKIVDDGVKSIPIIGSLLGIFTGIINYSAGVLDEWNTTLTKLSIEGASFNNNLMMMRGSAARAGLTLEEFASIINANASGLSQLGGTVTKGAEIFSNVSSVALRKFGNSINNLAGGWDEYASDLPNILGLIAPNILATKTSVDQLAVSSLGLVKEMDQMSKLTGENRKAQLDQIKKQQQTAAYQMKYAEMSIAQRARADAIMNESIHRFGPEIGGQVARMVALGTVPQTDAMKMLTATTGGAISSFREMQKVSDSTRGEIGDFGKVISVNSASAVDAIGKSGKVFESIMPYADKLDTSLGAVWLANKQYADQTGQLRGDILTQARAAADAEQKSRDASREALNNFTRGVREGYLDFFNKVIVKVNSVIAPMMGAISKHMGVVLDGIIKIVGYVSDKLAKYISGDKIGHLMDSIMSWVENIKMEDIKSAFATIQTVFSDLKDALGGVAWFTNVIKTLFGQSTNNADPNKPKGFSGAGLAAGAGLVSALPLMFSEGTVSKGNVIHDFGRETPAMLHGKEAVLTEQQLQNLVNGVHQPVASSDTSAPMVSLLKSIDSRLNSLHETFGQAAQMIDTMTDLLEKGNRHASAIVQAVR